MKEAPYLDCRPLTDEEINQALGNMRPRQVRDEDGAVIEGGAISLILVVSLVLWIALTAWLIGADPFGIILEGGCGYAGDLGALRCVGAW